MSRPRLDRSCSTDFECSEIFGICVYNKCQCREFDWWDGTQCRLCSGFGDSCEIVQCCSYTPLICGPDFTCICRNGLGNVPSCAPVESPISITASQIALSGALVMGIAALTMIIYRLCTRPRYLNARQRALASQADADSITYASILRASLTSMQIRVLSRLRDRPPSYDSRQTPVTQPELPPPYERSTQEMSLPPVYSEIVVSTTGYTNAIFVDADAEPPPISRSADGSVGNGNSNNNNIANLHCDSSESTGDTSDKDKVTGIEVDEKAHGDGDESRIPT